MLFCCPRHQSHQQANTRSQPSTTWRLWKGKRSFPEFPMTPVLLAKLLMTPAARQTGTPFSPIQSWMKISWNGPIRPNLFPSASWLKFTPHKGWSEWLEKDPHGIGSNWFNNPRPWVTELPSFDGSKGIAPRNSQMLSWSEMPVRPVLFLFHLNSLWWKRSQEKILSQPRFHLSYCPLPFLI